MINTCVGIIKEDIRTYIMQMHVPDSAMSALIQRQAAHSAVVLPSTPQLAHFGVVALKTGCHEAGSTENGPRTSNPVTTKAPIHLMSLSRVSEDKYVQFCLKMIDSDMESGPRGATISERSIFCI